MKVLLLYCCALMIASSSFQTTEKYPGPKPDALFFYHPRSQGLLLIGGSTPAARNTTRSDVWIWKNSKWDRIEATGPGSRDFFMGTFNTTDGNIYFFAGRDANNQPKGDMWMFNGSTWSIVPTNYSATRDHHNFLYMEHLKTYLVFGGSAGNDRLDTLTWLAKDGRFSSLNIPGPGQRFHYGMVYDQHRKKAVLYGGGYKPNELWEFDGTKWEKIITKDSPGPRLYHKMVYDEALKMTVLHGGWVNQDYRDPVNKRTPTTWGYDGSNWKKLGEKNIFSAALAYDPQTKKVTVYGRESPEETSRYGLWQLENTGWKQIASY